MQCRKKCGVAMAAIGLLALTCGLVVAAQPAAPVPVTPTALYSCPMHPQIQWSQPATCPLCGMALKLKTPAQQPSPSGSGGQPTVTDHIHHDAMGMGGCMECMRMNGMGGMSGMGAPTPVAPAAGAKIMAPASMRMSGGRGCGC